MSCGDGLPRAETRLLTMVKLMALPYPGTLLFERHRAELMRDMKFDEASAAMDTYLDEHPDDPYVIHLRALEVWQSGKLEEAERVLRENLTGLLQTIAREVKVQVAFEPAAVDRWRLLGYENRDVADRDFRNDAVDAGEVGAGHQVTALYELKVTGGKGDLGTVRVRYEYPAHDTARAGRVVRLGRHRGAEAAELVEMTDALVFYRLR